MSGLYFSSAIKETGSFLDFSWKLRFIEFLYNMFKSRLWFLSSYL